MAKVGCANPLSFGAGDKLPSGQTVSVEPSVRTATISAAWCRDLRAICASTGLVLAILSPIGMARESASASMSVTLQALGPPGEMSGLSVEEQLAGIQADPLTPLLELPHVVYNVPTVATTLANLAMIDSVPQAR